LNIETEESKLLKIIEAKADELEIRMEKRTSFSECGLCSDCRNLIAICTKFGKVVAKCFETYQILNSSDPVEHCTRYNKLTMLSIFDMKDMAILIELKKPIGFLNEDLRKEE